MTLRTNYDDGDASPAPGNVTAADMNAISGAVNTNTTALESVYTKPSDGIPATDLAATVQSDLELAASALQSVPDTDLADQVSGVLAVGNGGTGTSTLTGLIKGNGASEMTAAIPGTDYIAPGTDVPLSAVTTKGDLLAATGSAAVARLGVGSNGQSLIAASGQSAGLEYVTLGGRGATVTVAPSGAPTAAQYGADFVCTGTNDDVTINDAIAALSTKGGTVRLLGGTYNLGSTSTSFIDAINEFGGITLEGEPNSTTISVPGGTSAPMAIRMAAWGTGSGAHVIRDIFVYGAGTQSTPVVGIWMQSTGSLVEGCTVQGIGGHGIVLDGAPTSTGTSVTAPTANTFDCLVTGCTVELAGSAILHGGAPGDAFYVKELNENSVFRTCWAPGGYGPNNASAVIATALTQGDTYTSLSVSPLTGAITSGDKLIIAQGDFGSSNYQVVTASANAAEGATTIPVDSFEAAFSATIYGNFYVADLELAVTRNGFYATTTTVHYDDCHPYRCYQAGLYSYLNNLYLIGGEWESNGWVNLYIYGLSTSQGTVVNGASLYGLPEPCAAHIWAYSVYRANFTDIAIVGGTSCWGIYLQGSDYVNISDNVISDCLGNEPGNSACYAIELATCASCIVANNTLYNITSGTAAQYGILLYAATNTLVSDNNLTGMSGSSLTPISVLSTATGTIVRDNLGFNPVGVKTVSVPSSGSATTAQIYDQTFYITASTGTTTAQISNGPTITIPASSLAAIRVPAGQTLKPTYTNAPTWAVEGE